MYRFKFLFFLAIIVLTPVFLSGQGFQNIVIEEVDDLCFGRQSEGTDAEAELIMDQMMAQMQLKRPFKIRKCTSIGNAYATIQTDENNKQQAYILYDPVWLKEMANASKTDWASIGVLAHEVGHLLSFHALDKKGSNPRWEVDADRFAGSRLAMMGSTLEEAQSMFKNYTQLEDSRSHPGRDKRLEAVKTGWMSVNNPVKRVILNENTAERDVSPELIVNRYFESLGGFKALSQVKQINFKETFSETKGEDINQTPIKYTYDYEQSVNKLTIVDKASETEYLIKNDTLFYKYTDQDNWKIGAPRVGTSFDQDPYMLKNQIQPSTKNFFDDFLLVSNPEVTYYKGRRRIADEECFLLEMPEEKIEIGNLNKKGKRIILTKQYYFSTYTGRLYGIIEREQILNFKKGKIKNPKTIETKKIISDYEMIDNLYFPKEITITETDLINDVAQGEKRYQQRSISEFILDTEVK